MNNTELNFIDKPTNQAEILNQFLKAFFPEPNETIFLRAFEPKDAPKKSDEYSGEKSTARSFSTSIANLRNITPALQKLNKTHGVYFVVNSGGNKDADITHFNAVFVESDELTLEEQNKRLDEAPIEPSIRVETKKSIHAYWLLNGNCSEEEWREIQKRLIAYFHGDIKINNPARLMRLPSFNHVSFDKETKEYSYKQVEIKEFHPEARYTAVGWFN